MQLMSDAWVERCHCALRYFCVGYSDKADPHSSPFDKSYPQPFVFISLDKMAAKRCNPPFFLLQGLLS